MIIIGERINASRPTIQKALQANDIALIQSEAKEQLAHGASYIDVNCGLSQATEADDMERLVTAIRAVSDAPLCIDSPSPEVIERGVRAASGKPLINSITAQEDRYKKIIPIALKHDCSVIALTMDEKGMPETADDRLKIADKLYGILKKEGLEDSDILFDPLVRPISSEPRQAEELLKAIPKIKALGGVKIACGVSNISYGLPRRKLVNSIFLSMALCAGLDGALIDPLDKGMIAAIRATEAILAKDRYCMNFIQGHRKGLF